jgi:hypothetical protein
MAADSARLTSRATTVIVLAAAHGLVLWLLCRLEMPRPPEVETFTSLLYWAPAPNSVGSPSNPQRPVAAVRARRPPAQDPEPAAESGTAITLPAAPRPRIDWSAALSGSAAAELDRQTRAGAQLDAVTRKYARPTDPLNPGAAAARRFRWYDAGIHRIDTRGPIPALHLNDRCLLIAFIIPACVIGHIEIHGDLFEGIAGSRDETTATARPNDVP